MKFTSIIDEIHLKNIELALYLREHLSEKYFTLYIEKLKLLKESYALNEYAIEITKQLQKAWELTQQQITHQPETVFVWPQYIKYGFFVGLAFGVQFYYEHYSILML